MVSTETSSGLSTSARASSATRSLIFFEESSPDGNSMASSITHTSWESRCSAHAQPFVSSDARSSRLCCYEHYNGSWRGWLNTPSFPILHSRRIDGAIEKFYVSNAHDAL